MSDIINSQCTHVSEDFSRHTYIYLPTQSLTSDAYVTTMITTTTANAHICLLGRRQEVRFILLYFITFPEAFVFTATAASLPPLPHTVASDITKIPTTCIVHVYKARICVYVCLYPHVSESK